ncbi:MAG: hypothetical protein QGH93_03145 [Gammaproteobacteria bacterium]|jgi:hypothetical protein|nr:hypothetical protein [Chromatiales bacterium]MDP6673835.1 hypothetical protein [Gammaproteobacteria bacterium]
MSEGGVDLSQIRGDWKFHIDYIQNAVDQTLKRQAKYWNELGNDADIGADVEQQVQIWADLNANANDKGTIPTADGLLEKFISSCRDARARCDAYQDKGDSELVEEFTEACRQTRGLCDDLEMMIGQRPDDQ